MYVSIPFNHKTPKIPIKNFMGSIALYLSMENLSSNSKALTPKRTFCLLVRDE
jgi:hypothetical protein